MQMYTSCTALVMWKSAGETFTLKTTQMKWMKSNPCLTYGKTGKSSLMVENWLSKKSYELHTRSIKTLQNNSSGLLYLLGMPGCGKTHTVYYVRKLLNEAKANFKFVELNRLKINEPKQAYCNIWK
jgi:Cdc6-like AAA superfamily ATPase